MKQFDAAPPVPLDYDRLRALSPIEIALARDASYVAATVDPVLPVQRAGLDNCAEPRPDEDLRDWRARMCVVWFCYVYENLLRIDKPLYAVEELILEFKAIETIDVPNHRLTTFYAGAGGWEPTSVSERMRHRELLAPHYAKAVLLLAEWNLQSVSD
jgi:hypothetical protein